MPITDISVGRKGDRITVLLQGNNLADGMGEPRMKEAHNFYNAFGKVTGIGGFTEHTRTVDENGSTMTLTFRARDHDEDRISQLMRLEESDFKRQVLDAIALGSTKPRFPGGGPAHGMWN